MKRFFSNRITLLIISVFVFTSVFVACKKDKLTEPQSPKKEETYSDDKTKSVVKRIKSFENQLKNIKEGTCRQDFYIDVDSAMWNIEALFNATFSSPDEKYADKKIQELSFDIDIHRDNKLSMRAVNSLYDEIIMSVREAYINDGFTHDKGLMSIVVKRDGLGTRAAKLNVTVISGTTTRTQSTEQPQLIEYGPFKSSACWYYGEYGGSCDDPNLLTDAAELLEDTINYFYGYVPAMKSYSNRNIYVDMTFIQLNGNEYKFDNGKYYLFYKNNCDKDELYLNGEELNRYYSNIKKVIFSKVPNDPRYVPELPKDPSFMEINIDGLRTISGNDVVYNHQCYILYGSKCEVSRNEMGSVKDILTYGN